MPWRNNWFVQNVLAEIPIAGPFFQEHEFSVAVDLAIKCSFMILGGSLTMYMVHDQYQHDPNKLAQHTLYMTAGMASGKIGYNCAKTLLFSFCANREQAYAAVQETQLTEQPQLTDNAANGAIRNVV